ncbi:NADP-dependent malic enzyme [Candidatus Gottesmanbacteria bacterium]|nr:NADP-dependent malic enzyme [Candidatus Gottesmanbacteria bacterium]MBI5452094.1 NADP-dependent malic enzyme [Candidatus Gottesmanbacteria bacterium]
MKKFQSALLIHHRLHGKLIISSKIPVKGKKILSLIYTPGVAEAVIEIAKNKDSIYDLTIKNNTIAVVTDGSAVLGLGNVGPEAALPVMEGKCAIFAEFADINAFPICLKTQNVDEIIQTIKNISPVFGGINLEDIAAPACFEIEERLQKELDIPVMHDDQHATAIVVLAGLINSAKVVNKDLKKCKVVITGAGAAGNAIAKLLNFYGVENIILVDSKGIIGSLRKDLDDYKKKLLPITNKDNLSGDLKTATNLGDILIGVSQKGIFTREIIKSLNHKAIVFALANPDPEVTFSDAKKWGVSVYACGRSDYPNQINNALVFPGFFRGLLKGKITKITNHMKVNAAQSLASLIKNPTPNNFIPSIFDNRLVPCIVKSLLK